VEEGRPENTDYWRLCASARLIRLCWLCRNGFPKRLVIKLPRC